MWSWIPTHVRLALARTSCLQVDEHVLSTCHALVGRRMRTPLTASGNETCASWENQFFGAEGYTGVLVAGHRLRKDDALWYCGFVVFVVPNKQTSTLLEPSLESSSYEMFVHCKQNNVVQRTWMQGKECLVSHVKNPRLDNRTENSRVFHCLSQMSRWNLDQLST